MRILHVIQSSSQIYGAERCVLEETVALARRGHEVTVLLCHEKRFGPDQDRLQNELSALGIATERVETQSRMNPKLVADWWQAHKRLAPDVVHSHSLKTDALSVPVCRGLHVPLVIEVHGYLHPNDLRIRLYEWLDGLFLRCAQAVLTLSRDYHQTIVQSGVAKERTFLLPSGLHLDRLAKQVGKRDFRAELGFSPAEFVVGMVARLSPEKGHEWFLSALDRLRGLRDGSTTVRGVLFGAGSLEQSLRREIADRQLDVTLAGYVEETADAYRSLDALVSCSRLEGLPLNVIEAMSLGVPVLAMATGGCRDIVQNEVTGLLVPRGDVSGLSQAIGRLATSPVLRAQLGQAGRVFVEEHFSPTRWVVQVEHIYRFAQWSIGRT
jgi:glycosyltransferase involved in cell wall biosynthesis